jgi:hypothetical protein
MDPIVILLIIIVSILTILLVIVGIHVIQILREARLSIEKINHTIDGVDQLVHNFHSPLGHKGGLIEGVKTGLKVAEEFIYWLKKEDIQQEDD